LIATRRGNSESTRLTLKRYERKGKKRNAVKTDKWTINSVVRINVKDERRKRKPKGKGRTEREREKDEMREPKLNPTIPGGREKRC